MYSVNGSVPKTFMREIIRDEAERYKLLGRENLSRVLIDVVETPVSPELLPVSDGENKQHTERIVGPYELHDFFIYHMIKYRRSPRELFSLAKEAFSEYSVEEIKRYLEIFIRRFFSQQFKRSCLPDGPRVTEISLSPRGAWQMPSDVSGEVWLNELR
jgi:NAD+ synthase (glutamine-hydrolysing)